MSLSLRSVQTTAHPSETDSVTELGELAQRPSIELGLASARGFLAMDLAYTSQLDGDRMTVRGIDGDGESFQIASGTDQPLHETYCHRVMTGRLPNIIPDVRRDDRAASLAMTELAGVGAFTSVPLRFADGRVYGTLCTASHHAMPSLGYRELQYLHVVARVIADQLERDELEVRLRRVAAEASAGAALWAAVERGHSYPGRPAEVVDLLWMTTALRNEALKLLDTATHMSTAGGPADVPITHMQGVANELGVLERILGAG